MAGLKEMADTLAVQLKGLGFVIQRYDAYSTNSVYLKLDYGVCNSIRISDHQGKKHLAYRYNLLEGCPNIYSFKTKQGWDRYFYPAGDVDDLIFRILSDRDRKFLQFGRDKYSAMMSENQFKHQNDKGFWQQARIV